MTTPEPTATDERGVVGRAAEVLAAHMECWPLEEGVGYQIGWACECGVSTEDEDDLERGREWHTAHVAEALDRAGLLATAGDEEVRG